MLDMSGSMHVVRDAAVEGTNDYIRDLKDDETGETLLSLTAFDTIFETWHVAEPVESIPTINDRYEPRGLTALFDAIANSIIATEAKLKEMGREDMKVLHVTLTDGGENASQEYPNESPFGAAPSNAALVQLVKDHEAKGNWTFVYLGSAHANLQQAQAVAGGIGYRGDNAMLYANTVAGVSATTSSLGAASRTHRQSGEMSSGSFFADAGQSEADYADPNASAVSPAANPGAVGTSATSLVASSLGSVLGGGSAVPPEKAKPKRRAKKKE